MESEKPFIRKAYQIGRSTVVAIAPPLTKKLGIDDLTYFEQIETEHGILLKIRRLQ